MRKNIFIKGGFVVDPKNKINYQKDIFIENGKIAEFDKNIDYQIIDATGYIVTPGLIDFHAHLFYESTDIGVAPDITFLPQGVTTAVDAGSAGCANIENFIKSITQKNMMRTYAYLNVSPTGLSTVKYHENVDPAFWDSERIRDILEKYAEVIKGIKIRFSNYTVGDLRGKPGIEAIKLARKINTKLVMHVTDCPVDISEISSRLSEGDVLAHVYHGKGNTIVDKQGHIKREIFYAQQRGVVMDAANGGNHWSFRVAHQALKEGLRPDIISTDLTQKTIFKSPVFSLPYILSKYLMLGMSLEEVIACSTYNPAKILGIDNMVGSLESGKEADIAIFKPLKKVVEYSDTDGDIEYGEDLIIPVATILRGDIVYRSLDFV